MLTDIKYAYANATGFPLQQIKISEDNVVEVEDTSEADTSSAGRRLRKVKLWEVLVQLVADPSGTSTITPDYVVN
jgi:hypothetical protein